MSGTRRLLACAEAWPDAEDGMYDPRCCRFPKSCSPYPYPEQVAAGIVELEPAVPPRPAAPVCTCCPPGKRPAIEHAKGCPKRAPRNVPLSTLSVGEQLAADATAGDGLREAWTADHSDRTRMARRATVDAHRETARQAARQVDECFHEELGQTRACPDCVADEVLAALRDVLAAAARDAEKVRRVEELADEWAGHAWRNAAVFVPGTCADRIRRALDPS